MPLDAHTGWVPPSIHVPSAPPSIPTGAAATADSATDDEEHTSATDPSTEDAQPELPQAQAAVTKDSPTRGDGVGLLGIAYGNSQSEDSDSESSDESAGAAPVSFF